MLNKLDGKLRCGGGGAQVDLFLGDQCSYVFEALF